MPRTLLNVYHFIQKMIQLIHTKNQILSQGPVPAYKPNLSQGPVPAYQPNLSQGPVPTYWINIS